LRAIRINSSWEYLPPASWLSAVGRRQIRAAALLRRLAQGGDEVADVGERLAGSDAEALVDGAVGDADAEPEASAAEFVDQRGLAGEVGGLAEVDRLDGGAGR
jgi:hypothetical protein